MRVRYSAFLDFLFLLILLCLSFLRTLGVQESSHLTRILWTTLSSFLASTSHSSELVQMDI
jgi:hypothetical protein